MPSSSPFSKHTKKTSIGNTNEYSYRGVCTIVLVKQLTPSYLDTQKKWTMHARHQKLTPFELVATKRTAPEPISQRIIHPPSYTCRTVRRALSRPPPPAARALRCGPYRIGTPTQVSVAGTGSPRATWSPCQDTKHRRSVHTATSTASAWGELEGRQDDKYGARGCS